MKIFYEGRGIEVSSKNGIELAKELNVNAIAMELNGEEVNLSSKINEGDKIKFITLNSRDGRLILLNTAAKILAYAVKKLYNVKLGEGRPQGELFYYEFYGAIFKQEDLEKIEKEVKEIAKKDISFEIKEVSKEEAKEIFKDEPFKLEIIEKLNEKIKLCYLNDFVDLCLNTIAPSTGYVKAVKILNSSSSYWQGIEGNPTMQRIYGIAFESEEKLDEYLKNLEEIKKRDHRILGQRLDIFHVSEICGAGLPLLHPNGQTIRLELIKLIREINDELDFQEVFTPHIFRTALYKQSGHYEKYRENMFLFKVGGEEFAVKPMNCPGHIQIYKSRKRSYKELPIRYSEFATVYRNEKEGELSGLTRVRMITQDDGHIWCKENQIEEEVERMVKAIFKLYKIFGFNDIRIRLSTKPDKYIGSDELWEKAENQLKNVLEKLKVNYFIGEKEGAFYGPKIDFLVKDVLGREWQLGTIQLDFFMPQRFNMKYKGEDNKEHTPVMIHRAFLGSLERFMGIIIEHFEGNFPVWLSPVQVAILPISDEQEEKAREVLNVLRKEKIRCKLIKEGTLNYRIREATLQKIPYLIIIGKKEVENEIISVRKRSGETKECKLEEFVNYLKDKISSRSLEL